MRLRRLAGIFALLACIGACPPPELDAAETGTGRIVIVPRLAGRRIKTDAPVPAEVSLSHGPGIFRNLRTRLVRGTITLEDIDGDDYTSIRVAIDTDPSNPIGMPGDLEAKVDRWSLRRDGQTLRGAVGTKQLLRLVRPEDTRLGVARSSQEAPPAFHSPVTVAWDRVPGATSYRVDVVISGRPTRPAKMPVDTVDTSCTIDLEPTAAGESYWLQVEAYRDRERVGYLKISGVDMRDQTYRFRVVPPEERADEPKPPLHSVVPDIFGGTARLAVVPMLDGRPWELAPRSWARIALYGEATMKIIDVRPVNGIAELGDLAPGTYTSNLTIEDAHGETPGPHTSCRTRREDQLRPEKDPFELRLENGTITRQEVPLWCAIRLRRPEQPPKPPPRPVELSSPVTFEWSPVPRAVRYAYEVQRFSGSFAGGTETVARGETSGTDVTTPLEPSLLESEYYRFVVSAHGRHKEIGGLDQLHTVRVAGGKPEPGVANVQLVPTFDGIPLAPAGDIPTTVHLGRPSGGDATITTRLASGVIELPGIETGIYSVSFVLDQKHPRPGPPNEDDLLWSAAGRPLAILRNGGTVRHEVAMHAPFELTAPPVAALGSTTPRGTAPETPMLRSPVRIAWKPVRGAKRYRVTLETPGTDDEEPESRVSESSTPSWTAALPPTAPRSYYFVIVEAFGAHAQVGATLFRFGVEGHRAVTRVR